MQAILLKERVCSDTSPEVLGILSCKSSNNSELQIFIQGDFTVKRTELSDAQQRGIPNEAGFSSLEKFSSIFSKEINNNPVLSSSW